MAAPTVPDMHPSWDSGTSNSDNLTNFTGPAFTGSSEVGMQVYRSFAKAYPKPVIVEMGGKNPMIVLDDANLDLALDGALWGAFGTTGQRCTATSRAVVVDSIADEFVRRLAKRTAELKVGDGSNTAEADDIGSFVVTLADGVTVGKQQPS